MRQPTTFWHVRTELFIERKMLAVIASLRVRPFGVCTGSEAAEYATLFWLRSCECVRTAARTKLHLGNPFSRRLGCSISGTPIPSGLPIYSVFVLLDQRVLACFDP